MLFTTRETIRYVTFAIAVGGALGASYAGALSLIGRGPAGAIIGGTVAAGVIAVLAHLGLRAFVDREAPSGTVDHDADAQPADTTTTTDADQTSPTNE